MDWIVYVCLLLRGPLVQGSPCTPDKMSTTD